MVDHANIVPDRVDWVDIGKGFCIIMVVMMHSTLGVGAATGEEGWMHHLVAFAKPFRMPDFFLIAGLFLARRIDHPWRSYIDSKVIHFLYFYVLWLTIQFALRAPGLLDEMSAICTLERYFLSFIQPFSTLWFIYILPICFVVTRLSRVLPAALVWVIAAALEIAPIHTGWTLIDEFAGRFVYFYSGYLLAPWIFRIAASAQANVSLAVNGLLLCTVLNGVFVFSGWADLPFISLALGFAGAAAVVAFSALLTKVRWSSVLSWLGEHSIIVYLAFFAPMAFTRIALLKTGIIEDIGTISLLVTIAGITGPVVLFFLVRNTPLAFVFRRPAWARLSPAGTRLAGGIVQSPPAWSGPVPDTHQADGCSGL